jgi:hypothetical protein
MTPYNVNELNILKECFQLTGTMLSNFIDLVGYLEDLSKENQKMIEIIEQLQVPFCYEHLRLEYLVTFNETKIYIDELKHSMFNFPHEIDCFLHYIKYEPSSSNYTELFGMLEATYRYYCSRFDVIKDIFDDNKMCAQRSYEDTLMVPRPCGA